MKQIRMRLPFEAEGIDFHLARFIQRRLAKNEDPLIFNTVLLLSYVLREGSLCLDLDLFSNREVIFENGNFCSFPSLDVWRKRIEKYSFVGKPGNFQPLILDDAPRLYFYRYWEYERKLTENILARVRRPMETPDETVLKRGLQRYFASASTEGMDWQKVAAVMALFQSFCVISGGPGTGKTSTIIKILALLLEQPGKQDLRVVLAAPTGKAAFRLEQVLQEQKGALPCPQEVKARIPEKALTIHRLLGVRPFSSELPYHAENPLALDVLILDEASLIDIPLMSKLFQAIPPHAKVIILGDKDQLVSVEAGALLRDLCQKEGFGKDICYLYQRITGESLMQFVQPNPLKPLHDHIVVLKKNYRFGEDTPIYKIGEAVKTGDGREMINILQSSSDSRLRFYPLISIAKFLEQLEEIFDRYALSYLNAVSEFQKKPADSLLLEKIFLQFKRFQILCVLREGPWGVKRINQFLENKFLERSARKPFSDRGLYPGRPIIMTRNHYSLKLSNGDFGVLLPVNVEGTETLRVFFKEKGSVFKNFSLFQISDYETAYATTVHKAQGSEFEEVVIILSPQDSPVFSRELLYTALTRARRAVSLFATESVLKGFGEDKMNRRSGLTDRFWGLTEGE